MLSIGVLKGQFLVLTINVHYMIEDSRRLHTCNVRRFDGIFFHRIARDTIHTNGTVS